MFSEICNMCLIAIFCVISIDPQGLSKANWYRRLLSTSMLSFHRPVAAVLRRCWVTRCRCGVCSRCRMTQRVRKARRRARPCRCLRPSSRCCARSSLAPVSTPSRTSRPVGVAPARVSLPPAQGASALCARAKDRGVAADTPGAMRPRAMRHREWENL